MENILKAQHILFNRTIICHFCLNDHINYFIDDNKNGNWNKSMVTNW